MQNSPTVKPTVDCLWKKHEGVFELQFQFPGSKDLYFFLFQVLKSDGLDRTRELAREHCDSALSAIEPLTDSKYKWALESLTDNCLNLKVSVH